jgi:hypothetical protein
MGKKNRTHKVSHMNKSLFCLFTLGTLGVFLGQLSSSTASSKTDELQFSMSYDLSPQPLTTEQVWTLDPGELNPHRRRWVLNREIDLKGLIAVKKDGYYALQADKVVAHTTGYVRRGGSYLFPIADFPCTSEPEDRFATQDGVQYAAQLAAKSWQDVVSHAMLKLDVRLRNVRDPAPELALKNGRLIFDAWLADVDHQWRIEDEQKTRGLEWDYYRDEAKELNLCTTAQHHVKEDRSWASVMEPVRGPEKLGPKYGIPLAIAPARRWSGLFTIRVSIQVGQKEILGKFLIDSGAPMSVISPTFLKSQGVMPEWLEVPKASAQRIYWSGGGGVAKPAVAAKVKVSGFSVPLHRFMIHETDFFGPPDSFSSCCDGILGADFLRLYAVTLDSHIPNEVRIYPREGFQFTADTPWTEVSVRPQGTLASECVLSPVNSSSNSASNSAGASTQSVLWDTGNEDAIEIGSHYKEMQKISQRWSVSCDGIAVANSALISPKEQETLSEGDDETLASSARSIPTEHSMTAIGMEVLGRGAITWDLGHGRLWFEKAALSAPIIQNHSGLNLEYQFINTERVLKVKAIRAHSPASALAKAGLRVGSLITSVDAHGIDELDQWDVDQRLSGVYGPSVDIEWKTSPKTQKVATLKVR